MCGKFGEILANLFEDGSVYWLIDTVAVLLERGRLNELWVTAATFGEAFDSGEDVCFEVAREGRR